MFAIDRWCPECGFNIILDGDASDRCGHCRNQATGPGVEKIDEMVEILGGLLSRATWEQGGELRSLGSATLANAIRFWASLGLAKIIEDNGKDLVLAQGTPEGYAKRSLRHAEGFKKAPAPAPPPTAHGRTRRKKAV